MFPKGPLGRQIYKKLKVYAGAEHPHAAQQPKPIKFASKPREPRSKPDARRFQSHLRHWSPQARGGPSLDAARHRQDRHQRRTLEQYFGRETSRMVFRQPLELTETSGQFDVFVNVRGGGLSGQADAIRHGISRASSSRARAPARPQEGRLPDPRRRQKERKKYGQRGARARFQFSKR